MLLLFTLYLAMSEDVVYSKISKFETWPRISGDSWWISGEFLMTAGEFLVTAVVNSLNQQIGNHVLLQELAYME